MDKKNIGLIDIANESGCSIATVSRFLNEGKVSPKLSKKISEVIRKHNFVKNISASSLRKRDESIYIICDSFYKKRTQILVQSLNEHLSSYFVFVCHGTYEGSQFQSVLQNVIQRNPSHIILLISFLDQDLIEYVNSIKNHHIYILTSIGFDAQNHHLFILDDFKAFKLVTSKVIERFQPTKIAYVGRDSFESQRILPCFSKRVQGFITAVEEYNQTHKKLKYDYHFLQEHNLKNATDVINQLIKKGYCHFICGTHTIFIASLRITNPALSFSDYGPHNLSDSKKKYSYKIFTDFDKIGKIISDSIINQELPKIHLEELKII
ncbi:MAG: LacI family DNA-binding transcriptional regulator [Mycoplasmoidaceae bacterium]